MAIQNSFKRTRYVAEQSTKYSPFSWQVCPILADDTLGEPIALFRSWLDAMSFVAQVALPLDRFFVPTGDGLFVRSVDKQADA